MDRYRRVLTPFISLAIIFSLAINVGRRYHRWLTEIHLDTGKPEYYHYEFVDIRLSARDPGIIEAALPRVDKTSKIPPLQVQVLRQGIPISSIGGLKEVDMNWDESQGAFVGQWPCPWNAPAGEYNLIVANAPSIAQRVKIGAFKIIRRKPAPLPHRFVVLTMESVAPFGSMKIRTPNGDVTDWRGMLDWVQFIGADAFWILAGETRPEKTDQYWISYNLPMMPAVAKECHRRGIKFGVYAQCYLTMSQERLARYQYAEDIDNGEPVPTRSISLADPQRPKDIVALLKNLKQTAGVDYVGLDYIRNALGGYELVDDFFKEMTWIPRPENWDKLSRRDRIMWFARKKVSRKDGNFIDAWQWWRAHRVALIVHRMRQELGYDVPLWAFTLTWDKGWQHGQDPVMMNDAGVDADALMLYEANAEQFESMMHDWHAYVHRGDVQLVVGDVIDWPLHQRSPRGPGELVYRMERAIQNIYQDGHAEGIFFHDLSRALWGRVGPYSTRDWMTAAKTVSNYFRALPEGAVEAPGSRTADRQR